MTTLQTPAPRRNGDASTADRVYVELRDMMARFAIKPEERINEGHLARLVSSSRTPLREALNRLSAEGFVQFRHGKGFYCRALNPDTILELYGARQAVEAETARLSAERANDESLAQLGAMLEDAATRYHGASQPDELVRLDEEFHLTVAEMAENAELLRMLENLNARSRFIRLIHMETRREITPADHWRIYEALASRDGRAAGEAMRDHVCRRRDEVTDAVRQAFSRLYVPEGS